ncbi:MAG: LysR family transcriptional regulator [Clostridia bacterium]|nr:LysR family transcriptional regulator [Clostridia bacterium]
MELTQLRYFLRVYRERNICNASEGLNVTQQAVSRQIQKLEQELGVELFVRTPRGVKPTVYADRLAEKAQKVLPELDAFVYDLRARGSEVTGVVNLGIRCWLMSKEHLLRYDVLAAFSNAYPRVKLLWQNDTPRALLEGVRSGRYDLVVTGMPEDPTGLELTPLRSSRWFMLMSRRNPLADKEILYTEDLAGRRLILADDETASRNSILRRLVGKEPPVFVGVKDFVFDLIGQQIEGENALMLTTGQVLDMFNPERFAVVPLEAEFLDTALYLVRRKETAHSPAENALYQHLLENWSKKTQQ